MHIRSLVRSLAPILLSLAFSGLAEAAGTATSNMAVSATVSASCTISAGALTFGTYDTVSGTAVPGTATLAVACTSGSVAAITLDQGLTPAGGSSDAIPLRAMSDGTDTLNYKLYTDLAHSTIWGNTSGTSAPYTALSSAAANVTVFGLIAAAQDVPAGAYVDTVIATISF